MAAKCWGALSVAVSGLGILVPVAAAVMNRPPSDDGASSSAPKRVLEVFAQPYQRTEARANSFTGSAQENAVLDLFPDGSAVVAWESRRQEHGSYGVYLQRFDASGLPVGGETHVNVYKRNMQMRPAVAVDPQGGTWAAWESFGQDGSMNAVVARRFAAGFEKGSDEVLVNQTTQGHQGDVVIAPYADGGALIVWTTPSKNGVRRQVFGRRMSPSGVPAGPELAFSESENGEGAQPLPAVAALPDDRVLVVWAATNEAGQPVAIRGRMVDSAGNPDGEVMQLVSAAGSKAGPVEPSVCVGKDGAIAVSWMAATGDNYSVWAGFLDAEGRNVATPFLVSDSDDDQVSGAAAAIDSTGRLAVAWNARPRGSKESDIFVRLFTANGQPAGSKVRLNVRQEGSQRLAIGCGGRRLAWGLNGRLACAWQGDSGFGDKSAANITVLARRDDPFRLVAPPVPDTGHESQELAASPHVPPVYDPDTVPRDPFGGDPLAGTRGTPTSFLGITNSGWNPPDPHLACGPNHLVAMTNGRIAFFTKTGTMTFEDEIEDNFGFWGPVGATNFVFDPEVIFDPHSNRFMAMACERSVDNRSFFLLAVSDDENPNGVWHKYRFDVTALADNDIDSPNIGVDDQAVYLTADFFGPDRYLVYMVEKAAVLTGAVPDTRHLLITGGQSMGIPVIHESDAPAQYLLQAFEGSIETQIRLHAITDPLGNPQRVTINVPVPAYGTPEDPPQMGTSARPELFEARIWSCAYRDGALWVVHHQNSSRVRVRFYRILTNNWPAGGTPQMVMSGEIDPGSPVRTFFPSIYVDEAGSAVITCARSSPSEFISMGRAVFSVGDPAGFRPLEPVIESSAPFISSRWGDYSATVPDPVRLGKFWGIHEYTPGGNSWNTWIARYHAGPCDTMGDENGDCAIDLADMEDFSDCMWGLTLPSLFTCRCFDFDDDTFVSLSDFAEFQLSFTGGAAIPGCDP